MKKRIMIIEDDPAINHGIELTLGNEQYEFFNCLSLADAENQKASADLIILDLNLPDGNGLEFLRELRKTSQVPVLILTANDTELDEVTGLSIGADDYVTKPFSLMALRLRVQKLLQRSKTAASFDRNGLSLDFDELRFTKDGMEIELSKTEIRLQSRKLNELIQALVKMSRLETGIFQYQKEETSLMQVTKNAAGQEVAAAKAKSIKITIAETNDVKVMIDAKWVTEAVGNILNNAVKYSDDGTEIVTSVFSYEMFSGIRIADQGIGVAEEEIPKIFSRFYRGKAIHDREGIGVGLWLARQIVEDHGGYIKVASREGQGSTFDVCFPNMT